MGPDPLADLLQQPTTLLVVVGLATVLLLIALLFTLGGSKGDAILLLGPSGSGKTTLFFQLRDGSTHLGTVASMEPNEDVVSFAQGGRPIRAAVVDVAGHSRVRHRFEGYMPRARGIVFVLDSVDFSSQKSEVAEALYEVLTHPIAQRRRVPLLLACNKADAGAKAFTPEFIRKRLEKEIEALRATRRSLADSAGGGEKDALRSAGSPFTFDGLARGRGPVVTTAAISASNGDLAPVHSFVRKLF